MAAANSGNVSDALAEERFALLDNLQHIIPSDQARIENVVFSARSGEGILSVAVNDRAGTKLHGAFKRIERQSVTDIGRVEIVNSPSKTSSTDRLEASKSHARSRTTHLYALKLKDYSETAPL